MSSSLHLSRRGLLSAGAALALSGCGRGERAPAQAAAPSRSGPAEGQDPLEWAVAGDWRAADRARDPWRHPLETLRFFGLRPGQTVVELWPGSGWYTRVLAPYLAATGGKLYAAQLQTGEGPVAAEAAVVERYRRALEEDRELYGDVTITAFGETSGPLAPPESADLVLFLRNVHNWMAAGIAEKAFRDAFAALRHGGKLGVEEHRAPTGGVQDPLAASGYVQEDFVRGLAQEAGFQIEAASEINANPRDTKDHPFGVWTLPPVRRSSPRGQPANPAFDRTRYDAIGESDRMTLRFRKP